MSLIKADVMNCAKKIKDDVSEENREDVKP